MWWAITAERPFFRCGGVRSRYPCWSGGRVGASRHVETAFRTVSDAGTAGLRPPARTPIPTGSPSHRFSPFFLPRLKSARSR